MYKKIIVPFDGSELAECVLPHVESIALSSGTEEVLLVTVTERYASFKNTAKPADNYEDLQPSVAFSDRPYSARSFTLDPRT